MDNQINNLRDQWLDQFRNKWDDELCKIRTKQQLTIDKIDEKCELNIKRLADERDNAIRMAHMEYENSLDIEKKSALNKRVSVIKYYDDIIKSFISSHLNTDDVMTQICQFITSAKKMIFEVTTVEPEEYYLINHVDENFNNSQNAQTYPLIKIQK